MIAYFSPVRLRLTLQGQPTSDPSLDHRSDLYLYQLIILQLKPEPKPHSKNADEELMFSLLLENPFTTANKLLVTEEVKKNLKEFEKCTEEFGETIQAIRF